MSKPLGLPVGSVRALLLLGLGATAVLDLRRTHEVPGWLLAALVVSGSAYFAARSSAWRVPSGDGPVPRQPLGLPAGTVRFLFLGLVGYGAWLWTRHHDLGPTEQRILLVVAGFWIGVMVRAFMAQIRRPEDPSTLFFEHLVAIAALACGGGLVWLATKGAPPADLSPWAQPAFAAVCTHYAGFR
jgi:hypothetical protein